MGENDRHTLSNYICESSRRTKERSLLLIRCILNPATFSSGKEDWPGIGAPELMLNEIRFYSRMAIGISKMLRAPLPADPSGYLRQQFENRETNFLDTVRRAVFAHSDHPYAEMFRLAQCSYDDLADSVRRQGLEPTLSRLRQEGIYLTHDEWKGKSPILRCGQHIPSHNRSFANPLVTGWMAASSSGSRGRPVVTPRPTAWQVHTQLYHLMRVREFNLRPRVWIDVKSILPSSNGLNSSLRSHKLGTPVDRWFSIGSTLSDYGHYRAATRAFVMLGNLLGAHAPYPTYLPPNDFSPIAAHIAKRRSEGRLAAVSGIASSLVRTATAAQDKGYDISGTMFFCAGEALTPGKLAVFHSAGCEAAASYGITEVGHIGHSWQQNAGKLRPHLRRLHSGHHVKAQRALLRRCRGRFAPLHHAAAIRLQRLYQCRDG